MSRKKKLVVVISLIIIALPVIGHIVSQLQEEEKIDDLQSILAGRRATIEYYDSTEVAIAQANIMKLHELAYMALVLDTEKTFDEDWIYRITFESEWGVYQSDNYEKVVVLIGKNSLHVGDSVYVAEEGVEFEDILEYVEDVYNFILTNYENDVG